MMYARVPTEWIFDPRVKFIVVLKTLPIFVLWYRLSIGIAVLHLPARREAGL